MLVVPAMKPRKLPPGPVRVRYGDVVKNVEDYLSHPDTPADMRKRFEHATGLDHGSFSHRMSEYRNERFQIEHFGAMMHEANAPWPWPFVSWADADDFQAFKRFAARGKRGG